MRPTCSGSGIISRANELATKCGVAPGMPVREAAELLKQAPWPHTMPPAKGESRHLVEGVICADSASLLKPEDQGRIVATGSHAALNAAAATAPFQPLLLMFNDAGFGADRGGVLALAELDKHGIAAIAVAAQSAVHRRWPLHSAGRNNLGRQRGGISARRPCGRLRPCTGARGGRKA